MGILNATPDSFSDGGNFMDASKAADHALDMEAQGAGIIDIGGESTRPGAVPVTEAEELRRVMPIIERLSGLLRSPISIDTMKEGVARAAVAAGASIINDVGGNQHKPGMWRLAAQTGCSYVAMHMRGTPQTMHINPQYSNVSGEVLGFLENAIQELGGCGLPRDQIIIDPGIGFGKTAAHNVELLARLGALRALGRPVLVGVSRKSFLAGRDAAPPGERLPAGLACACLAVQRGANIIRTHDVRETLRAVRMAEEILAAERVRE
jgi:dihydropteroate synthase